MCTNAKLFTRHCDRVPRERGLAFDATDTTPRTRTHYCSSTYPRARAGLQRNGQSAANANAQLTRTHGDWEAMFPMSIQHKMRHCTCMASARMWQRRLQILTAASVQTLWPSQESILPIGDSAKLKRKRTNAKLAIEVLLVIRKRCGKCRATV